MPKKHWISVKRGLSEDPKHREKMGMSVWGFLHMIDRADWETGLVYDWRDKDEADDMCLKERTLRDWRNRLNEEGYIACKHTGRGLEITIFNWINPKDYGAGVINPKHQTDTESDILVSPSDLESDTTPDTGLDTTPSRKSVTPPLDSESKGQNPSGLTEKEKAEANALVDAILDNARKAKYPHREKFPETLVGYADLYVELTGQEPQKKTLMDWISTFSDWQGQGIRAEHIRAAYKKLNDSGIVVTRPGSLTNTAYALASKPKVEPDRPPIYHYVPPTNVVPNPRSRK